MFGWDLLLLAAFILTGFCGFSKGRAGAVGAARVLFFVFGAMILVSGAFTIFKIE